MLLPWTQNVISELVWFNRTIITSDDIYSLLYLPVDSTKTKLYIRYRVKTKRAIALKSIDCNDLPRIL